MRSRRQASHACDHTRPAHSETGRALADKVIWRSPSALRPFPNNPRIHPREQIARLMASISRGWTNPLLIDEDNTILAGHGRLEAASKLGMTSVPTLTLSGLSDAEKRAIVISDNKLPEQSVWNIDLLKGHLVSLVELDFDVELTGFSTGEIDILLETPGLAQSDPTDDPETFPEGPPVSKTGDLWVLGDHRILCADSLQNASLDALLDGEKAQLVITDPPYNVRVEGHVRGHSPRKYREFAMASGEMSEREFEEFLSKVVERLVQSSASGSIHYIFMDWRHLPQLLAAARPRYSEWKNLLVWNKSNAGLGAFYRSKHELIGVFKSGRSAHINNFGMGDKGRYRSNVLDYAGATSFGSNRDETFNPHPTVKPCALIADLIRDCSRRNGIVLDPFGGSGTALIAAHRTGRRARLIELDPGYVDLTIRRWEQASGLKAHHAETGLTFQAHIASHDTTSPKRKKGVRK